MCIVVLPLCLEHPSMASESESGTRKNDGCNGKYFYQICCKRGSITLFGEYMLIPMAHVVTTRECPNIE